MIESSQVLILRLQDTIADGKNIVHEFMHLQDFRETATIQQDSDVR